MAWDLKDLETALKLIEACDLEKQMFKPEILEVVKDFSVKYQDEISMHIDVEYLGFDWGGFDDVMLHLNFGENDYSLVMGGFLSVEDILEDSVDNLLKVIKNRLRLNYVARH